MWLAGTQLPRNGFGKKPHHTVAYDTCSIQPTCEVKEVQAVKILNSRSEYSASLGALPAWVRPLAHLLPFYASGSKSVDTLAGVAVAAVAKRLVSPNDRTDLLSKLLQGKDEAGRPLGSEELSAEALSFLVAGSDTTAK